MNSARERLSIAIDKTDIRQPQGTVVANVDGMPHENPETWRALLNAQLSSPVRWHQSLGNLEDKGFATFIELGPGTVLTGLVKRGIKGANRFSINTPEHLDSLLESLAGPLTSEATEEQPDGEHLYATERLIVSPNAGIFTPNSQLKIGNPVKVPRRLGESRNFNTYPQPLSSDPTCPRIECNLCVQTRSSWRSLQIFYATSQELA